MKIENIALFSYFGNKDKEMHIIKDNIPDMDNIDTIIEPYCGSFALIRYLISIYPNKKYICNDNDKMLIKIYKALQDDKICNELVEFFKTFEVKGKAEYDKFNKENSLKSYLFTHIIYRIRNGIYTTCGDNVLLNCFYDKYNIKIKFETTIFYRGEKSKEHKNLYVSNY